MTGFDEAITLQESVRPGRFGLQIGPDWAIGDKPNGGYLTAAMARAAQHCAHDDRGDHLQPTAVSAHFLQTPEIAQARIEAELLRHGRQASQYRVSLFQGDNRCVEAIVHLATLPTGTQHIDFSDVDPIVLPPIDQCVEVPVEPPGMDIVVGINRPVEQRLDPSCMGFAVGKPSMSGELRGYLSFRDGRPVDPLALLFAVDAFPPAVFEFGHLGWVPTFQLSSYVRAIPAPGPLTIRQKVRVATDRTVDEICDVWDSEGVLVASATQLAGYRPS